MRRFLPACLTLFASCLEPTEVDVTITTDLACGVLRSTDIEVFHDDQWRLVGTTTA